MTSKEIKEIKETSQTTYFINDFMRILLHCTLVNGPTDSYEAPMGIHCWSTVFHRGYRQFMRQGILRPHL